jgi:hypothetical protein
MLPTWEPNIIKFLLFVIIFLFLELIFFSPTMKVSVICYYIPILRVDFLLTNYEGLFDLAL